MRATYLTVSFALLALQGGTCAFAGSILLGEIPVPANEGGIDGAAFVQPDQLLAESQTGLHHISLTDGSIIATSQTSGAGTPRGLAYQQSTNQLFDVRRHTVPDVLYRVPMSGGLATRVHPTNRLGTFNVLDMSFSPSGTLWLITDHFNGLSDGRAVLYKVDPSTGVSEFEVASPPDPVRTFTAIGINPAGDIFGATSSFGDVGAIYQINPATGALKYITPTDLPSGSHFKTLDMNPATGRWYGVQQSSDAMFLRELTGIPVPEPTTGCIILGLLVIGRPRHRHNSTRNIH